MRLWSLHPKYLDRQGLLALWREALLAQAVLAGRTLGYKNHPQLKRFSSSPDPSGSIAAYLEIVWQEATDRGYQFDKNKITSRPSASRIAITDGQLRYELEHLRKKLEIRSPKTLENLPETPEPNPVFLVTSGLVADWEKTGKH